MPVILQRSSHGRDRRGRPEEPRLGRFRGDHVEDRDRHDRDHDPGRQRLEAEHASPWDVGDPNRRDNQQRRPNRAAARPAGFAENRRRVRTTSATSSSVRQRLDEPPGLERVAATRRNRAPALQTWRGSNTELERPKTIMNRAISGRFQRSGLLTISGSTASSAIPAAGISDRKLLSRICPGSIGRHATGDARGGHREIPMPARWRAPSIRVNAASDLCP